MKKTTTIAMAFAALMAGQAGKKALAGPIENQKVQKESMVSTEKRRKGQKKSVLEPGPIPDINPLFPAFTSPIFFPTHSQKIKNKLNRKYYGRNRK